MCGGEYFGPRKKKKQERSSVPMLRMEAQPLKEAIPEGGSITVLFCHAECT
jgi:hypothetical protein